MSTSHSVGRPTATNKKDRSRLCAFTFADGRQCRTPRRSGHQHLCYFHAQKEAERLAAQQVGEDISRFLPAKLLTACDLSGAMARVFCAIARGDVKPKLASTLAYLSQSMVQSIPIAQHEYCEAFGSDAWRREIRASFNVPAPQPKPAPPSATQPAPPLHPPASKPTPQPTPQPASQPDRPASPQPQPVATPAGCHSERSEESASSSNSPLATHHSFTPSGAERPLPQSLPHKPLPPTSAEFAQQVLAGLPTGSLPATPHVQPLPPNPQPAETPANCHSERGEESAFSSSSPTSPTPASASLPKATPPLPPGFGAPANWDVLLSPRTRRTFSRQWQSLE